MAQNGNERRRTAATRPYGSVMADLSDVTTAGGVVWRRTGGEPSVCLVHRPHKGRFGEWSLPKGKVDSGEHPVEAAVREVAEETGIVGIPQQRMRKVKYETKKGKRKVVQYWAMAVHATGPFRASAEIAEAGWFPLREAFDRLTHERDRAVLVEFARSAPATSVLLLARVAKRWDADRLARIAMAIHPQMIIADSNPRCVETLEPLSRRAGLHVRTVPDVDAADLGMIAASCPSAVVCTTGSDVDYAVHKLLGEPKKPTRKGEAWFMSFRGDEFVGQWRLEGDED